MRKLILLVCLLLLTGCGAPPAAKSLVRDKHAQLAVLVKRLNNPEKKPTYDQVSIILKSTLKDYESLDKLLNGWKPTHVMPEVNLNGDPQVK